MMLWTRSTGPTARRGLVLFAAALTLCCGRREHPAAPAPTPGATPAAATTDLPAGGGPPSIRASAEPNRPPFAGLRGARGIARDGQGRLWVADFEHGAVRIFDAAGGYLGGWGSRGDGPYQLKDPCGIAIRGDDVYVADTWNGRVLRFSLAGKAEGKAPGDFYGPRGIAVGPDGKVWVADTGNSRIVSLERDLSSARYVGKKAGSGPEEFSSPIGIAVGPSGRVYVADSANRRVQILDGSGAFQSRFAVNGWGPNTEPYLAVDSQESLYASDPASQSVLRIDRNGRETKRWTTDDAGKKFSRPTGLALDEKKGLLYVANTDFDAIVKIKLAS